MEMSLLLYSGHIQKHCAVFVDIIKGVMQSDLNSDLLLQTAETSFSTMCVCVCRLSPTESE